MYVWHSSHPKPKPVNKDALMLINRVGKSIGKLKIAVNVELLFVLLAIADPKERMHAMPMLPRKKTRMKREIFSMGMPKNKLNAIKLSRLTTAIRRRL